MSWNIFAARSLDNLWDNGLFMTKQQINFYLWYSRLLQRHRFHCFHLPTTDRGESPNCNLRIKFTLNGVLFPQRCWKIQSLSVSMRYIRAWQSEIPFPPSFLADAKIFISSVKTSREFLSLCFTSRNVLFLSREESQRRCTRSHGWEFHSKVFFAMQNSRVYRDLDACCKMPAYGGKSAPLDFS